MRGLLLSATLAACGDGFNGIGTPEQVISGADEGQAVEVTGEVHTVTFESSVTAARLAELAGRPDGPPEAVIEWILGQDDEEARGDMHAFDDAGAGYPRATDRYILLRTVTPEGITFPADDFSPTALFPAWGLGVHLPDLAPGEAMPEIGARVRVSGTFHMANWNNREIDVPTIENPTIQVLSGPAPQKAMGEACSLDQECNARLICDRATTTCQLPPREIYWADPFRDVNGACLTDDDCPLGQFCDPSFTPDTTGPNALHYFVTEDANHHLCRLVPGATVASQCPRIYSTRDLVGGRFVTGKEVCVRAKLFVAVEAEDNDTHAQMLVDEPIPYPTADAAYNIFGATTENGPAYKDPDLPGGPVVDPVEGQEVIAIGTYRYDPDHGWYEVHPVKAYLPPP